jgi:hypothetical protein
MLPDEATQMALASDPERPTPRRTARPATLGELVPPDEFSDVGSWILDTGPRQSCFLGLPFGIQ